jgi:hypothetical protein
MFLSGAQESEPASLHREQHFHSGSTGNAEKGWSSPLSVLTAQVSDFRGRGRRRSERNSCVLEWRAKYKSRALITNSSFYVRVRSISRPFYEDEPPLLLLRDFCLIAPIRSHVPFLPSLADGRGP